mgnify:CR=1 FL=1
MDPLALLAVVGLAFAGKQMSDDPEPEKPFQVPRVPTVGPVDSKARLVHGMTGTYTRLDPIAGVRKPNKEIQPNFAEVTRDSTKPIWGQPVYDLYNRQDVSSKMNNLAPTEKQNVGPGLGVGSNVASYGGYHQFFRVLPTNTNVQRLTQLPGRSGGPARLVKNGPDNAGDLTQERPNRVFNHESAAGRAVVTGQMPTDSRYVKGEQMTLKDQLVSRSDYDGIGNPGFAIDSGHIVAPRDIKSVRRQDGVPDIVGGKGRMNVRADPSAALGGVTSMRAPPNTATINHKNASGEQTYVLPEFTNFNAFKDTPTPNQDFELAKKQLAENPFNHSLSG